MDSTAHRTFSHRLFHHRSFRNALILLVLLSVFLGLLVVPVELRSPRSRIRTMEEGLWWAVTTVTGVGYGDYVPVTTMGRIIGAALEISGVTMFGLLIGIIGITMTKRQEEYTWFRLFDRLNHIEERIERMEKKMDMVVGNTLPKRS